MLAQGLRNISQEFGFRVLRPGQGGSTRDLPRFRGVVVVAIVVSLWITWPLWGPREHPILLPVAGLPQVTLGPLLIAASLLTLVTPRAGAMVVTALIAYGMVTDQTRMQPEFFSLPLLLWGSLASAGARLIGRVSLISLWFFAGLHKVLSPDFMDQSGPRLVSALPLSLPQEMIQFAVVGIAALEIGTAALAVVPATRGITAWSALALHAGILLAFSPLAESRNVAVWPWNIVLACSGFALIAPWKTGPLAALLAVPILPRLIAVFIAVAPASYYLGILDAYPAHHLYSSGTASATVYCPAGCRPEQDLNASWYDFNVPLPPEPRLFEATFSATCAPGDVLRIRDPHPPPWSAEEAERISSCPAGSLPFAHP
jgi:hypothetical protein